MQEHQELIALPRIRLNILFQDFVQTMVIKHNIVKNKNKLRDFITILNNITYLCI